MATILKSPVRFCAKVTKGFQRGSKDLGWPTANLENTAAVAAQLETLDTGIYCGWCAIGQPADGSAVYKAAISVGHNPTYKGEDATKHKMIEPYLLHEFPEDFYDQDIRVVVCGYIRPEADFSGEADFMKALKAAIGSDVDITAQVMDTPEYVALAKDAFLFTATPESFAASLEGSVEGKL